MIPIYSSAFGVLGYVVVRDGSAVVEVYDARFQYLIQLSDRGAAESYLHSRAAKADGRQRQVGRRSAS